MSVDQYKELGQYLRECRESRGDDVEKISKQLNIRPRYLKAIEEGNFDSLPGAIYTEGYLKTYAEYLRLDPKDVIKKYKYGTVKNKKSDEEETFALPAHDGDKYSPDKRVLIGAGVAVVVLYGIWHVTANYAPAKAPDVAQEEAEVKKEVLTDDELTVLGVMTGRVGVDQVQNPEALTGLDADSHYTLTADDADNSQPQETAIKEAEESKEAALEKEMGWKTAAPAAGQTTSDTEAVAETPVKKVEVPKKVEEAPKENSGRKKYNNQNR